MGKKLFIIDGYYHIYRAFYAPIPTTLVSLSGEPTNGTYIFTTSLLKLIREQMPDMLVVAMEGKSKTFRSELCGTYKANRSIPSDDFLTQRDRIEEILAAMHIPVLRVNGYEADDIIGTVSKKAQQEGCEVFICSIDKDMLQLVDSNISIFNMKTGEYTDTDKMIEKTKVSPDQFIDYLALQGDSGDNVLGIPGVGPKTSAQWIVKYGSIKNLFEHLDELSDRHKNNLIEFKNRLMLGKKLVTIDCNVLIPFEDYGDFTMKEYDKDKLRQIFTELGFTRLLVQLDLIKEKE